MEFLDSDFALVDVSQGGDAEESAYQGGCGFESAECGAGECGEVVGAFRCGAAEVVVLDVLLYPFVRVKVG
jgi:hypothetical protein